MARDIAMGECERRVESAGEESWRPLSVNSSPAEWWEWEIEQKGE